MNDQRCILRRPHNLARLLLVGFGIAWVANPGGAQPLPSNISEANLGDANSSLSVRVVEVPYFIGEHLILEVTIRNVSQRVASLPRPQALFIEVDHRGASDGFAAHECPNLGTINDIAQGQFRCLKHLRRNSVPYAPGQARSATWVSPELGRRTPGYDPPGPPTDAVFVYSHDVLPVRSVKVTLHPLRDPIRGQVLQVREHGPKSFFWISEAWPGQFLVFRKGSWYAQVQDQPPQRFDAATLKELCSGGGPYRQAVVPHPHVNLKCDVSGTLLIDGRPVQPRQYKFAPPYSDHGWVVEESSSPTRP